MLTHLTPSNENPDRVVVIGARGFIGAALLARLAAEKVPALAVSSQDIDLSAAKSDEALTVLLRPTDAVVMLSCRTPDKGRDLSATLQNLAMGFHFTNAVVKAGCRHIVYFSSDAVYADDTARVTDDTKAEPGTPYGAAHLAREVMLKSAAAERLAIIRPTLVYGIADTHDSYGPNRFRRMVEKDGKITLFGFGEERRDHIIIDDLVELTMRVLRRRSIGLLLGVTGQSHSFGDVAAMVARQSSPPAEIVNLPRANLSPPIWHRNFDITGTLLAFPDMQFVSLADGVAKIHRISKEAGRA